MSNILLAGFVAFSLLNNAMCEFGHVEFRVRGALNPFDHVRFNPNYSEYTAPEYEPWKEVVYDIGKTNIYVNEWIEVINNLCVVTLSSNNVCGSIKLFVYGPQMDLGYETDCRNHSSILLEANYKKGTTARSDISWNGELITNGFRLVSTKYAGQRLGEDFWFTNASNVIFIWTNQIAFLKVDFESITENEVNLWHESQPFTGCVGFCWFCNREELTQ